MATGTGQSTHQDIRTQYDKPMEDCDPHIDTQKWHHEIVKNYRPVALLNPICKIFDSIIASIVAPYMNMLANETQRDYKKNKSTIDVVYFVMGIL